MPSDRVSQMTEQAWAIEATSPSDNSTLQSLRDGIEANIKQLRELREDLHLQSEEMRRTQESVFLELLGVLDRLDEWLHCQEADEARMSQADAKWVNRLEMVSRSLVKTLAKRQVIPLDLRSVPAGTVTVIDRIECQDIDEECIHEVVERGWMWRGATLRKASVIIAVPTPDNEGGEVDSELPADSPVSNSLSNNEGE